MEPFDPDRLKRFKDAPSLIAYTMQKLLDEPNIQNGYPRNLTGNPETSAVLLLLDNCFDNNRFTPCLVLNKRSASVRQPGDLCCPGGRVSPVIDRFLARIFALPGLPLGRWPHWAAWRDHRPGQAARMAFLLATGLRECFEEMRLNPLRVRFIGPLPAQRLVMFRREIFPLAGWIAGQRRFFPNWEVEKIVRLPIAALLSPDNYARYRLRIPAGHAPGPTAHQVVNDYPCFVHRDANTPELLWGATYRIVAKFIERVFAFKPPALETLPVINGVLGEHYIRSAGPGPGK